ncbi:MAG: response regulator [Candidatus Omnitrophota bacterium]
MADISSKKILLVDDEEDVQVYLGNILKRHNYKVIIATNGNNGLDLAKQELPDLIVLDIMLPDIEGSDVASKLSEDPVTRNIPIIFLTAIIRKQEEEAMMKTGKHYILAKPAMKEDILALINKILN